MYANLKEMKMKLVITGSLCHHTNNESIKCVEGVRLCLQRIILLNKVTGLGNGVVTIADSSANNRYSNAGEISSRRIIYARMTSR